MVTRRHSGRKMRMEPIQCWNGKTIIGLYNILSVSSAEEVPIEKSWWDCSVRKHIVSRWKITCPINEMAVLKRGPKQEEVNILQGHARPKDPPMSLAQ